MENGRVRGRCSHRGSASPTRCRGDHMLNTVHRPWLTAPLVAASLLLTSAVAATASRPSAVPRLARPTTDSGGRVLLRIAATSESPNAYLTRDACVSRAIDAIASWDC